MKRNFPVVSLMIVGIVMFAGCTVKDAGTEAPTASHLGGAADNTSGAASSSARSTLSGRIMIDGSSTVFPISQAVAEEFQKACPHVEVVVGTSGTGGGFKKFVIGETDINDASRPIKPSEKDQCRNNGISYVELRIAIDGLSVVVNPKNAWCNAMTVKQLQTIWSPNSKVHKWSEINPIWPDAEIQLYGPDTDSGTFDYFTETICGEDGASRSDYTPSADDNVLVRGVSGDKYSLGYFGYAYYAENSDKLKVIGVAAGDDLTQAVKPTNASIEAGKYTPLARPLFLYVNKQSIEKPEVGEFLRFYLQQGQELVDEVGYVRLSQQAISHTRQTLEGCLVSVSDP